MKTARKKFGHIRRDSKQKGVLLWKKARQVLRNQPNLDNYLLCIDQLVIQTRTVVQFKEVESSTVVSVELLVNKPSIRMYILMLDTRNVVSNETNERCTYVH